MMPDLQQATALHQLGRLAEAERAYTRILDQHPDNPDALHLLGVAVMQAGRVEDGIALIARSLRFNPDSAAAHSNRGNGLLLLKRLDEAIAHYDTAIEIDPALADALSNRGIALRELGRVDEAAASFDKAIAQRPGHASAYNNRGLALLGLDRAEDALADFDIALSLRPGFVEAHANRGLALRALNRLDEALASHDAALALKPDAAGTHADRALVLRAMGRPEEALASLDAALALDPNQARVHADRGLVLRSLDRPEDALAAYDAALALNPDMPEAHHNRAIVLGALDRIEAALASYDAAVALKPDFAEAHNNRATALSALNRYEEAVASVTTALDLSPGNAEARSHRGMLMLLLGRFREGWPDYEWRFRTWNFPADVPSVDAPAWRGEDLDDRAILVSREQGLGDTIQFARYLPLLARRGARVTFLGPASLIRLFQPLGPGVRCVGAVAPDEHFDFQSPLMNLPRWFDTTIETIPADVPYLAPEPARLARWKPRIGVGGFRIGIAWQGNPRNPIDRGRSPPLTAFLPLSQVPGVRLIALQKNDGLEQLEALPPGMPVETLGGEFDGGPDAFIDTAAVMSHLDLIVTSDTAIAHLAGALGRPVWIALKHQADWRWLRDRADSPWYPTARLFRQRADGDWASVFQAMELALRSMVR